MGHGAFATVFLCVDPILDSLVAVKVLSENYATDDDIKTRFENEARILRQLASTSDRILQVYTIDRLPDGRPFFATDYADRGTLAGFIHSRSKNSGNGPPFRPDEAVQLSRDIALCLDVAHRQQIVHRDLKPSNVLFRSSGPRSDAEDATVVDMADVEAGRTKLMLADFGIARALEAASGHSIAAGTPQYMAPEQADGQADQRSDLYAAAVVFYQLLAGRTPYSGSSVGEIMGRQVTDGPPRIREVRDDLPEFIEEMLVKGMALDPDDRYQTSQEWITALDTASELITKPGTGGDTIPDNRQKWTPPPPPPPPSTEETPWWKRPVAAVAGVGLVALLAVLAFLLWPCTPVVPTGLSATPTAQGVQLGWDPLDDSCEVANVAVLRGGEELTSLGASADSYLDTTADLTDANEYSLVAVGENERQSQPSEAVTSDALLTPQPPANVTVAAVDAESIEVIWNPPADTSNVTGYGVYRDGELVTSVGGTATSYTDADVDTSQSYEYAIDSIATEDIRSALSQSVASEPYVSILEAFDIVQAAITLPDQVDLYEWEGEAGQFVTFFVNSDAAPPEVSIFGPDGSQIAQSDGSDAVVLNVRLDTAGTYRVTATFAGGVTGDYEISYSVLTNCPISSTCTGELEEGFVNEWFFGGAAGDSIVITLLPDTATPRIEIYSPDGSLVDDFEGIADGAVIVLPVVLPSDGDYIVAASFPSGSGAYRMSIYPFADLNPRVTITGTLDGPGAEFAEFHDFEGTAGTPFFVSMRSDTGDPEIFLFDPNDEIIASNDDFIPGTTLDAAIELDLPETGTYTIGATFFDGSGDYVIQFDRDLPLGWVGTTDSAATESEGQIDTYTFEATAGETVVIFMNSDLGTHEVSLWDRDGQTLVESATDSFIEYSIPESGFYQVQATFTSGSGPYTVWVTRFAPE